MVFRTIAIACVLLAGCNYTEREVVCRKKSWGEACKNACVKEGPSCNSELKHPYSPGSGIGKLWKCSGEAGAEECKYIYDNGEECTHDRKIDKTVCKHTSGS